MTQAAYKHFATTDSQPSAQALFDKAASLHDDFGGSYCILPENQGQKPASEQNTGEILEQGFLPKSGEFYVMQFLDLSHLDEMLALQDRVYADLPDSEKNFIIPKTREFFEKHLTSGHPIIGVVCGDQIVAQSIIRTPSVTDPKTGMTDMPHLSDLPVDTLTIMQGVLCDPAHRGNKLMQGMVKQWLSWAGANGRSNAVAEIEVRNHHSWSVFIDEGLWLVSIGHDKSDGSNLYNAHQALPEDGRIKYKAIKKIGEEFTNVAKGESFTTCPTQDLQQQKALMDLGYACRGWDKSSKTMAFTKAQP